MSGSIGLGALAGVLIAPAVQRRVRNEVRVITVCSLAATAVAIAYVLASGPVLRVSLIVLASAFLIGVLPLYWSLAMARMSGLMAAAGLAFINSVGLLGGFVGPYLYGWAEDSMGDTGAGYVSFVAFSVLGVLLIPVLHRAVRHEDAKAAAGSHEPVPTEHGAAGPRHPTGPAGSGALMRRGRVLAVGLLTWAAVTLPVVNPGPVVTSTAGAAPDRSAAGVVRHTTLGAVRGIDGSRATGTYSWLGIPYAEPPVGSLRWRAPVTHKPWETVRRTQEFGDGCIQPVASSRRRPTDRTTTSTCATA